MFSANHPVATQANVCLSVNLKYLLSPGIFAAAHQCEGAWPKSW